MIKKVKPSDHSVKVDNKTYNKILKLSKQERRSIRVTIEMAIEYRAECLNTGKF